MSSSPILQSAAELFSLHAGFVATFARRLGTELADVDDLVQETFLVVHRHGGFVPGEAKATTWLAAIALRLYKNRRRSSGRKPTTVLIDDAVAPGSPLERLEARSSLKRVQISLMQMDAEHRAVFVLFELQEQSCEDIAQAMQIPVGTVYSRLHKARKKFLRAYNQLETMPSAPAPYPTGQEL